MRGKRQPKTRKMLREVKRKKKITGSQNEYGSNTEEVNESAGVVWN